MLKIMSKIYWKLDDLYFAFSRAKKAIKNPRLEREAYAEGQAAGYSVAKAKVKYALGQHSPDDFKSEEFQLGYLYAQGVVQKVMP